MKINFTSFLVTEALIYAALVTALADSCIRITRGTITISQALVVLMLSYSYFSSAQQLMSASHSALTAISAAGKVTANREDVQIGIDVDSKITGLKGEGSYTVKKVYTRAKAILESWKKGKDVRCQIIAKLKDPDAVNGQTERWSANNVWHTELPVVNWEKGGIVEEETSIGFTPSDLQNLDQIAA